MKPKIRNPFTALQTINKRVGLMAFVALFALAGSFAILQSRAESNTGVVPIDFTRFSSGKPTDADSVRLEQYLAGNCKYAVGTWYNDEKNYDAQTGPYLNIEEPKDNRIREEAGLSEGCATAFATGIYDPAVTGVPETTARARMAKVVASIAKYHKANGGSGWGYSIAPSINTVGMFGKAGWLLWNDLSSTDQELVRKVMQAEADNLLTKTTKYYRDRSGKILTPGDSQAELLARQGEVLGLAVNMMPNHPNRDAWENKGIERFLGGWARPVDLSSGEVFHGKSLSQWLGGSNLENDGTITNHDRNPYPHYAADISANQAAILTYSLAGKATPQAALFNLQHVYRAFVDNSYSPSNGYNQPGGKMYIPGSGELYFPRDNEKPYNEFMDYAYLDVVARQFGGDSLASVKADVWEPLHAERALALLRDSENGVDVEQREYLNASWGARAYMTKWLAHQGQGAYAFHNQGVGAVDLNVGPPDTEAPTASLTSPAEGAMLSGTVPASATAADNVAVSKVELLLDGKPAGSDTSSPYEFNFNSKTISNGSHTLEAKAYDAAGNAAVSAPVNVTVDNPPVPAASITFQSAATASAAGTSRLSIAKPDGTVTGEVLIASLRQKKTTGTVTAPTGWVLIRQDGTSARSSLYYRVTTASEPTSYSFRTSTSGDLEGHILRYSGVSLTSPILAHAVGTNSGSASGTAIDAPTLTPTAAGGVYLAFWSAKATGLSVTAAAGITERTDTSSRASLAIADEVRTDVSGTGVRIATLSATSDRRIGQAILLRPAQ